MKNDYAIISEYKRYELVSFLFLQNPFNLHNNIANNLYLFDIKILRYEPFKCLGYNNITFTIGHCLLLCEYKFKFLIN